MSDDVAEGFVVQVAGDIDGSEVHKSINFFLRKSRSFAGKGLDEFLGVDFAASRGVKDLEGWKVVLNLFLLN